MMGSLVHVGGMSVEAARATIGIDGETVGACLDRIGYAGEAPCGAPAIHAFLELHIEQGPVLESEGVTIGVVEGVQGISWTEYTFEGASAHAGTTPMAMRHDAGLAAARLAVAVRRVAEELGGAQVGTVGLLTARAQSRQRRRQPRGDDRRSPQYRRGDARPGRARSSPVTPPRSRKTRA